MSDNANDGGDVERVSTLPPTAAEPLAVTAEKFHAAVAELPVMGTPLLDVQHSRIGGNAGVRTQHFAGGTTRHRPNGVHDSAHVDHHKIPVDVMKAVAQAESLREVRELLSPWF